MAKQGMKRPARTHTQPHNDAAPVAEIQGGAKHKKAPVRPIIAGTKSPSQKVFHTTSAVSGVNKEKPATNVTDNDLARDNRENNTPAADLQDL